MSLAKDKWLLSACPSYHVRRKSSLCSFWVSLSLFFYLDKFPIGDEEIWEIALFWWQTPGRNSPNILVESSSVTSNNDTTSSKWNISKNIISQPVASTSCLSWLIRHATLSWEWGKRYIFIIRLDKAYMGSTSQFSIWHLILHLYPSANISSNEKYYKSRYLYNRPGSQVLN